MFFAILCCGAHFTGERNGVTVDQVNVRTETANAVARLVSFSQITCFFDIFYLSRRPVVHGRQRSPLYGDPVIIVSQTVCIGHEACKRLTVAVWSRLGRIILKACRSATSRISRPVGGYSRYSLCPGRDIASACRVKSNRWSTSHRLVGRSATLPCV